MEVGGGKDPQGGSGAYGRYGQSASTLQDGSDDDHC
jgi:hypothetical protein